MENGFVTLSLTLPPRRGEKGWGGYAMLYALSGKK